MVKFASSLFVAALIAAPALASFNDYAFVESREVSDMDHDMIARDIQDLFTRFPHELSDMEIRELQELHARNKFLNFFKKAFSKAKSVLFGREDLDEEVFARDIAELSERDLDEFFERYFSEIEERSPFWHHLKSVFSGHHHANADSDAAQPVAREFFDDEELSGREFFDDEELFEREFFDDEELLERDFEEFNELD